ncbi:hypothetical protein [Parendozoicomonas sp. Alg238-R29]|uniref:hypothetical protein n=1 Tax=Parendozoicomonas sp. Alg238-R29 TaxID=2993446 RepID=UPI00248EA028|nr:hypothetical protein [Parendozoicomonas sp. Alg238-R29]
MNSVSWTFRTRTNPQSLSDSEEPLIVETQDDVIHVLAGEPVTLILEPEELEIPHRIVSVSAPGKNITFEALNVFRFTPLVAGTITVLYDNETSRDIQVQIRQTEL